MKLIKSLLITLILLNLSCSSDDDATQDTSVVPVTIAEFVSNAEDYSSLLAALEKTNLTSVFTGQELYTVFAPNNNAFETFLSENNFASLDAVPNDLLKQVLLNHVLEGKAESNTLSTGYVKTLAVEPSTMNNLDMYLDLASGVLINGAVSVTTADIPVSNGVIHAVDKVIGLPTVVDFAGSNELFSTLVSALQVSPDFTFIETLSLTTDPSPYTVFAPTNDAFDSLLTSLEMESLTDIPVDVLEATLATHVVSGNNVLSSSLSDGMEVTTLGEAFTISITNDGAQIIDVNGRAINIIVTDVQAYNGVIHVVDEVILPLLEDTTPSIVEFVSNNQDYSILLDALVKADLVGVFNGENDYTVFAPNNAAFEALLADLGLTSLDDIAVEDLKQILLNHVVNGTNLSTDLETSYVATNAMESTTDNLINMYINTSNGVMINGNVSVVTADVEVTDGVIHAVDKVITLPTVVTFATADPNFSSLVSALTRENEFTFVETLSGVGPFTVFAPTNDAFTSLLDYLAMSSLADIATPILEATLNTHVVNGANVLSSTLTDNFSVNTLGDPFTINVTGGATIDDITDRDIDIIITDVQASNGVIHVVSEVILPDTSNL